MHADDLLPPRNTFQLFYVFRTDGFQRVSQQHQRGRYGETKEGARGRGMKGRDEERSYGGDQSPYTISRDKIALEGKTIRKERRSSGHAIFHLATRPTLPGSVQTFLFGIVD